MKFDNLSLFLSVTLLLAIVSEARFLSRADGPIDYRAIWEAEKCINGMGQSPINIKSADTIEETSKGTILKESSYQKITPQAKFAFKKGYSYEISGLLANQGHVFSEKDGVKYKWNLGNIHFHVPSEHTVDGNRSDVEFHFIHYKDEEYLTKNNIEDKDPKKKALVMGVFFNLAKNAPDHSRAQAEIRNNGHFINRFPLHLLDDIEDGLDKRSDKNIDDAPAKKVPRRHKQAEETKAFAHFLQKFNLERLLDIKKPYFNYEGGLTTPKCEEIIEWIVFKNPVPISKHDFEEFSKWVTHTYPIGNARNTYPVNGRKIFKRNMN